MTEITVDTNTAARLLGCSPRTINERVHDFKELLSESARQPLKGRLYIQADLNTLATIERGYKARLNKEQIAELIRNGELVNLKKEFNDQDVIKFAAAAAENLDQAKQVIENYQRLVSGQQRAMGHMGSDIDNLKNQVQNLQKQFMSLNSWRSHVIKVDQDMNDRRNQAAYDVLEELGTEEAKPITQPSAPNSFSEQIKPYVFGFGALLCVMFACVFFIAWR